MNHQHFLALTGTSSIKESHFYHRAEHCIVGENKDDLNDGTLIGGIYMKGKCPKAYQGSRFGVCTDDMSG